MIRAMLMRPREIPALFQTAVDALAARATLVRGRRLLGPGLLRVNSLEDAPVRANEPTWDLQYKQQRKVPNGPRCCAPNTLVENSGLPQLAAVERTDCAETMS